MQLTEILKAMEKSRMTIEFFNYTYGVLTCPHASYASQTIYLYCFIFITNPQIQLSDIQKRY